MSDSQEAGPSGAHYTGSGFRGRSVVVAVLAAGIGFWLAPGGAARHDD